MTLTWFRQGLTIFLPAVMLQLIGVAALEKNAAVAQVAYLSTNNPLMVDLNPPFSQAEINISSLPFYSDFLDGTATYGDYDQLPEQGQRLYQAGEIEMALQFWQEAQRYYGSRQDVEMDERLLDVLGVTAYQLGLLDLSLSYFEQALIRAEQLNDQKKLAAALNNSGMVYQSLGQYDKAFQVYDQAIAIASEQYSAASYPSNRNSFRSPTFSFGDLTVDLLLNMGTLFQEQGQYERAFQYYDAANERVNQLVISQFSTPVNPYSSTPLTQQAIVTSSAYTFTGETLIEQGTIESGIQTLEQGLAIAQQNGDAVRQFLALKELSTALIAAGQWNEAIVRSTQLVDLYETYLTKLTDHQLLQLVDQLETTYEFLQIAYVAQGNIEKALELSERSRSRASISQRATNLALRRRLIRTCNNGRIPENEEDANTRCTIGDTSPLLGPMNNTRAQEELAQLTRSMTIQDIKALAQKRQATIVQYSLVSEASLLSSSQAGTHGADQQIFMWVVQSNGIVHFHRSSVKEQGSDLSTLIQQSRVAIGERNRRGFEYVNDPELVQGESFKELHSLLISPIKRFLPSNPTEQVIFIPQGDLFLVPFPALINEAGQHLIEQHTILTAPSIQLLSLTQPDVLPAGPETPRRRGNIFSRVVGAVEDVTGTISRVAQGDIGGIQDWFRRRRDRPDDSLDLVIVGNPTMPPFVEPSTGQSSSLRPLPFAEAEAIEISNFFDTDALIGPAATEQIVKQSMGDATIIHLATHGLLDYENPDGPFMRHLPGAIALTAGQGDDGFLTSAEILAHPVERANLVVLSACDTGVGTINSDGVVGLSRSFLLSGASSVVVSLWSVPDDSTALLMTAFYRHWLEDELDKAQALRQAMLTMKETHPDPADWAAFTLIGEAE